MVQEALRVDALADVTPAAKREHYVRLPLALHEFINQHKEAVNFGLFQVAIGNRLTEQEDQFPNDELKTTRLYLSPNGEEYLDILKGRGLSKAEAFRAAVTYLLSQPTTVLQVKL